MKRYKFKDLVAFLGLLLFFLAFLGLAIWEVSANYLRLGILAVVLVLFIAGVVELFERIPDVKSQKSENDKGANDTKVIVKDLSVIGIMIAAAYITWVLNNPLGWGLVVSSAVVGLVSTLIPVIFKGEFAQKLPVAIYCATFVGMTSALVFEIWLFALFGGLICGVILVVARRVYQGVGGKLGAMACLSVCITMIVINLLSSVV
jgi:hypothetical protein